MSQKTKSPRKTKLVPAATVFAEWRKDSAYRATYDALVEEFSNMSALIQARTRRAE